MPQITAGQNISDTAQINPGVIVDSDINAAAAIQATKIQALNVGSNGGVLPSTGLVNAHVAAGAAIAHSKLASGTQGGVLIMGASGVPMDVGVGTSGQYLKSQGAGANAIWADIASGWNQLADATGGGSASLSSGAFAARKQLRIHIYGAGFSTLAAPHLRINSDSGSNYAYQYSQNGGAGVTGVSQAQVLLTGGTYTTPFYIIIDIANDSTGVRKMGSWLACMGYDTAATAPEIVAGSFLWSNTAAQITSVDLRASTGNLTSGTRIVVYGKND